MNKAQRPVEVIRVGTAATRQADLVAAEEPLEVRLNGHPFAVIMRTPGLDRDLAAGFLLAEGVIRSSDDVGAIQHCADATEEGRENTINVTLTGDAAVRLEATLATRRQVVANSACGMCGRLQIDSLRTAAAPIELSDTVGADIIRSLPDRLRAEQAAFDDTGGLHGAALFTFDGAMQLSAEDVGRHNAVDKVIGRMLLTDRLPLDGTILFVSGRTSFEIVQKAILARIPIVGAVSAPSSLAVDLARSLGVTLLGFVRDARFNVYAHEKRIRTS